MIKQIFKVATVILLGIAVTTSIAQPRPPRLVVYKFFDEQYRQGGKGTLNRIKVRPKAF